MAKNCKKCNGVISEKDFKSHRNMNEILHIVANNKNSLTNLCEKCAKDFLDTYDVLTNVLHDWRGSIVLLNDKKIFSNSKGLSQNYLKFVNNNKQKRYTLVLYERDDQTLEQNMGNAQYKFEEIPDMGFYFHVSDLIIVEDNRQKRKESL